MKDLKEVIYIYINEYVFIIYIGCGKYQPSKGKLWELYQECMRFNKISNLFQQLKGKIMTNKKKNTSAFFQSILYHNQSDKCLNQIHVI